MFYVGMARVQISHDEHTKCLKSRQECLAKASSLPEVAYKPISIAIHMLKIIIKVLEQVDTVIFYYFRVSSGVHGPQVIVFFSCFMSLCYYHRALQDRQWTRWFSVNSLSEHCSMHVASSNKLPVSRLCYFAATLLWQSVADPGGFRRFHGTPLFQWQSYVAT